MRVTERTHTALQLIAIILISLDIINFGYLYQGFGKPLGSFSFESQVLTSRRMSMRNLRAAEDCFAGNWLGLIPSPVPAEYLQGIDSQKHVIEKGSPSYLRGEWRLHGSYDYYLYALLVKEPLGTLALVLWTLSLVLVRHPASSESVEEWTLLFPAGAILVFVSAHTGTNDHMRYILPIFPFLAVSTGKLAYFLMSQKRTWGFLVWTLMSWSVISSLAVIPHSLSYFNELAGGPGRGHDHLLDSNIDWGQDLLELKDWLRHHPEARPLGLAYYHLLDPGPFLGVDYHLPEPGLSGESTDDLEACGLLPGYYAISVNYLRRMTFKAPDGRGNWRNIHNPNIYQYFNLFTPIARAGYSIYIYRISPEDANVVRRRLGLPQLSRSSSAPGSVNHPRGLREARASAGHAHRPLGQLGGRLVAVRGPYEGPIGERTNQDPAHLAEQLEPCRVPLPTIEVLFFAAKEGQQKERGPAASRSGDGAEQSQDDSRMSPAKLRVGVSRRDRIAVAAPAVDVRTRMLGDRVITSQEEGARRREAAEDGRDMAGRQSRERPSAAQEAR